jgi:hypothetical protein
MTTIEPRNSAVYDRRINKSEPIQEYERWLSSLPAWIRTCMNERQRTDCLFQVAHSGQFDDKAQVELRDADLQRLKFEENPKIKRFLARKTKPTKTVLRRPATPPLEPLERAFAEAGQRAFKQLEFASQWGWSIMDIKDDPQAHTVEEVASRVGCGAKQLKKRFKRFGYTEDRLPMASYCQLEKLEADKKRQAAQKRQAKHRAEGSSEARAKRQLADREHKKQIRAAQKTEKGT